MKKMYLFCVRSLFVALVSVVLTGCGEQSLEIPYFKFANVSKYERDSIKTIVSYDRERVSEYNMYVSDSLVRKISVIYSLGSIHCVTDDVAYEISLSNTRGGMRAESINVTTVNGNARLYYIEYEYDDEGRLWRARLDGVDTHPIYNHYRYEGNTIIIDDAGTEYRVELSSEKNLGYVCNVLDYANAPITSKYIINPDLYFLNIYGAPVDRLPYGYDVTYTNNSSNLSRVGKYYYEY